MTRWLCWSGWLIIPIVVLGLHYGPGQSALRQDQAAAHARAAVNAAGNEEWDTAAGTFAVARGMWPEDSVNGQWHLALSEANARIRAGQLVAGQEQMETILDEMQASPAVDEKLRAAVRHDLATSCYYAAWMMRLEGAETDEWKQEAEQARRQFRLLAEQADAVDGVTSDQGQVARENLEATIRLEQMDLRALMARPLPKNCCSNCNSLCQKKRKQCASRCKSGKKKGGAKSQGKEPADARKEIKKINNAGFFDGELQGS